MPKNKDLKRLVRARMEKTGESYTTARARILEATGSPKGAELTLAAVAGYADDVVSKRTGRTWREWVDVLDATGAADRPHREIAKMVHDTNDVSGWWAQMVTVGYERIKGLREIGQRRGGSWDANKSKTVAVPVSTLYRAFVDPALRERWLPGVDWSVRTATDDRSIRIDWEGGGRVSFWFVDKGEKSSVQVQHGGHASKAASERAKTYWGERLEALAGLMAG